jgi:4'-phosphopantetheinyl transferase
VDDVLVWWAEASPPRDQMVALLTAPERRRLEAFRRDRDREMFVSAHMLLRLLIAADAEVPVTSVEVVQQCQRCGRGHGQPHVLIGGERGPAVSMAHADGIVVAARAASPVGVDLEPAGRLDVTVEAVILSDGERAALAAMPPTDRPKAMTRTWVRKEAVLKAAGTGLLSEPRDLVLGPGSGPPVIVAWSQPGPWAIADVDLAPGFAAAVAIRAARMPSIDVHQMDLAPVS